MTHHLLARVEHDIARCREMNKKVHQLCNTLLELPSTFPKHINPLRNGTDALASIVLTLHPSSLLAYWTLCWATWCP